MKLATVKH